MAGIILIILQYIFHINILNTLTSANIFLEHLFWINGAPCWGSDTLHQWWPKGPASCSQTSECGYSPAGSIGLSTALFLHTLHRSRPRPEGDSPGPKPSSTALLRGGKKPLFMGEGLRGPFSWVESALYLHLEHHGRFKRETALGKAGPSPAPFTGLSPSRLTFRSSLSIFFLNYFIPYSVITCAFYIKAH